MFMARGMLRAAYLAILLPIRILSRSRSVGGDARSSQKAPKRQSGAMRVEDNRVHVPQVWLIRLHRPIRVVCHLPGQSN